MIIRYEMLLYFFGMIMIPLIIFAMLTWGVLVASQIIIVRCMICP
jgi:hypothetical protein